MPRRKTEASIVKLGRKAIHRLKPDEEQKLTREWEGRLKAMGLGEYVAQDTHKVQYMTPDKLVRTLDSDHDLDKEPSHARKVGAERFSWRRSIESET
jgi:hypothetical protein